jgi:hypothetical protein
MVSRIADACSNGRLRERRGVFVANWRGWRRRPSELRELDLVVVMSVDELSTTRAKDLLLDFQVRPGMVRYEDLPYHSWLICILRWVSEPS